MVHEPSPAEEARLRRLLARSRHDETLPDDVAARLDDVLARLEAGDLDDEPPATVHQLAARRRRTVASVLVAAAAVVVVGVGLGQVVDGLGTAGSDDLAADNASTAESADRSQGRGEDAAGGLVLGELEAGEGGTMAYDGQADGLAARLLGDLFVVDGKLAEVQQEGFTRSAARIQRRVASAPATASTVPQETRTFSIERAAPRVRRAWEGCAPAEWGEGVAVAVLYERDPAVLVFRPADGESQVVDLLQCGTGAILRSVTLPAR